MVVFLENYVATRDWRESKSVRSISESLKYASSLLLTSVLSFYSLKQTAKKFLPSMACGYNDPRVTVHVRDAFELIAEVSKSDDKKYDVIVCDSTDPIGFASVLFEGIYETRCEHEDVKYELTLDREFFPNVR